MADTNIPAARTEPITWSTDAVAESIARIEATPEPTWAFSETRYPYTYAYDYMRSHGDEFGMTGMFSRAECAGVLRGNADKEEIVVLLADAYLREHGIVRTESAS